MLCWLSLCAADFPRKHPKGDNVPILATTWSWRRLLCSSINPALITAADCPLGLRTVFALAASATCVLSAQMHSMTLVLVWLQLLNLEQMWLMSVCRLTVRLRHWCVLLELTMCHMRHNPLCVCLLWTFSVGWQSL
jgi:hypothetical protein